MNSKAPELVGDAWFGIEQARLGISDFRGRFLLLDFWTLCCVNCHHVLAELRPLEEKYEEYLTVVGIHSPKFEHEKHPSSVSAAIARHDIHHPVLSDSNMSTWQSYSVRAWPTLVLIDPAGEIIARYSGEGHAHAIGALLEKLIPEYESKGMLVRGPGLYKEPEEEAGFLRQPGKVALIPEDYRNLLGGADLLISNSGGHSLVGIHSSNPSVELFRIGSGVRGWKDGDIFEARFAEPYGVSFLSPEQAETFGFELVIADTANHLLRAVSFSSGKVKTIAGTLNQWMQNDPTTGNPLEVNLSTPWDIEANGESLLIAMAGEHRIWKLDLSKNSISVFAGTTNEGLVDGELRSAWFAQPSAILMSKSLDEAFWVIDAETSALRLIRDGRITSVIGKGLFDFGHLDGVANEALLQHPLGAAEAPDGAVLIADSYNGAVRKYSPETGMVSTIARNLREPSDVAVISQDGSVSVAVVESAANRISIIPLGEESLLAGERLRTVRPALDVLAGNISLEVIFQAPPGQKLDDRFGPSTQLIVSSTPPGLLLEGTGTSSELTRNLVISQAVSEGVLHVAAKGASCESSDTGGVCHIHQQDWGIPIRVSETGENEISLVLSGNS